MLCPLWCAWHRRAGGLVASGPRSSRHENKISNRHHFQSKETQQGESVVQVGVWVARGGPQDSVWWWLSGWLAQRSP